MSDYLDLLEAEALFILRETAAQFARPVLLFSGGKDSTLLVHLARKAFAPGPFPFPLLHIDTGHNFPEALEFRDALARRDSLTLHVRLVQESIDRGRVKDSTGPDLSRNVQQAVTLVDAVAELGLDGIIGGGRRDEEKARAKERIFSIRDEQGRWDPCAQRPELWNLYNGALRPGQSMRVFPLSNWTELDVWRYIAREKIELPSIYFSHRRKVVRRKGGGLLAHAPCVVPGPEDEVLELVVRCRTVGDMTCTGLVESLAAGVEDVLRELALARVSERGGRMDDRFSDTAMEERKRKGYF